MTRFSNPRGIKLESMNRMVRSHADWWRCWEYIKCSCGQDLDPNQALSTCAVCGGTGRAYPFGPTWIRGIGTGLMTSKDILDAGMAEPGDMTLIQTMRGNDHTVSAMDLLIMDGWEEGQPYEGDVLLRGVSPSDTLAYQAGDVERVSHMDPVSGVTTQWLEGVDFSITRNRGVLAGSPIVWVSGHGPASGTPYSVKYKAIYVWTAFEDPQSRVERNTSLGNRVLLRKRHLVLRTGA